MKEQDKQHKENSHKPIERNPFIANVAKDYDILYEAVEAYYNQYGNTPLFYEKLEEHLKMRSF